MAQKKLAWSLFAFARTLLEPRRARRGGRDLEKVSKFFFRCLEPQGPGWNIPDAKEATSVSW